MTVKKPPATAQTRACQDEPRKHPEIKQRYVEERELKRIDIGKQQNNCGEGNSQAYDSP
jgi:hypothetical protein